MLVDTLEAVNKPVLSKVVLRIAGIIDIPLGLKGTFVSCEPSPANLAKIEPAEIVEKNP